MYQFANILILILGAGSIALWGEMIRRVSSGLPVIPYRQREPIRWNPLVLIVAFGWIGFQVLVQFLPSFISDSKPSEVSLRSIQYSATISLMIWMALLVLLSEAGRRDLSVFGLSLRGWKKESQYGALGFVASLLPVYLVILVTFVIGLRTPETQHTFIKMMQDHSGMEVALWIALVAIVLAPLTEELLFRVILQGLLQSKFSPKIAIGVSSVIFAGVHGFPDSIALIPLAIILGYVYYRRQSYLAVVLLHALFNLLTLLMSQMVPPPETTDAALLFPG